MSLPPSQDPVQLQMDRLPVLWTASLIWTVQAGRNAARDVAGFSAAIRQVSAPPVCAVIKNGRDGGFCVLTRPGFY